MDQRASDLFLAMRSISEPLEFACAEPDGSGAGDELPETGLPTDTPAAARASPWQLAESNPSTPLQKGPSCNPMGCLRIAFQQSSLAHF